MTSDGLLGYGLLAAAVEPRGLALYANERAIGERPLCATFEDPTPRLPPAHATPPPCTHE